MMVPTPCPYRCRKPSLMVPDKFDHCDNEGTKSQRSKVIPCRVSLVSDSCQDPCETIRVRISNYRIHVLSAFQSVLVVMVFVIANNVVIIMIIIMNHDDWMKHTLFYCSYHHHYSLFCSCIQETKHIPN